MVELPGLGAAGEATEAAHPAGEALDERVDALLDRGREAAEAQRCGPRPR